MINAARLSERATAFPVEVLDVFHRRQEVAVAMVEALVTLYGVGDDAWAFLLEVAYARVEQVEWMLARYVHRDVCRCPHACLRCLAIELLSDDC